jgi:hypothetical protein
MGITYGDHLIDSGYYDITPEQEREMESEDIRRKVGGILTHFHRNSCYPDAMDFEVEAAVDEIIAALPAISNRRA